MKRNLFFSIFALFCKLLLCINTNGQVVSDLPSDLQLKAIPVTDSDLVVSSDTDFVRKLQEEDLNIDSSLFRGKPIISIFTNINRSLKEDGSNGFSLTRAYLGYQAQYNDHFTAVIILDAIQDSSALGSYASIRNAYLRYYNDRISFSVGMIPTMQVLIHEEFWGYRYLLKSYQNKYGYGPTSDMGMSLLYRWNKMVYLDFSALNGENIDQSSIKYAIGATLFPNRNFKFRLYYDFFQKEQAQTLSLFLGYKFDKLSVGIEYDFQLNHYSVDNNNLYGGSIFASYKIDKKNSLMARTDLLSSNLVDGVKWNENNDGTLFLVGFDHTLMKNIRISPNYRFWKSGIKRKSQSYLYLNLEFKI